MRTCVLFSFAAVAGIACHASSLASGAGGADAGAPSDASASPDGGGEADARSSDAAATADVNDAGAQPGDAGPAPCVVTSYPDAGATLVGADAGSVPPAFNPACCPSPDPGPDAGMFAFGHPLSFSVTPGVSPAPDAGTTLVAVPDGYRVTLSPSLPAIPAGASLSNATISIVDLTRGVAYPSYSTLPFDNPSGPGFSPLVPVLPAGVMAITYALSGAFALDASSSPSFTSSGFQLLTVCGDGTVDVVLPDIPALTLVHVTIDQLQNAPPPGGVVNLTLTTPDRTFSAQASTTAGSGATSAVVAIFAPLGVPLVPELAGAGVAPTVTLAGDASLSVPVQVQGSGSITASDAIDTAQSSVVCTVSEPAPSAATPFPPIPATFTGAITGAASPYSYSILVPKGISCALSAVLAIDAQGNGYPGLLVSPPVNFDGTVPVHDFTLPPVTGLVTLRAVPTYVSGGNEASGAEHIRAVSTSLDGGLGGWTYSKDFNHDLSSGDWGTLAPGLYDLFESEPVAH